jgi:hypothetical protein
MHAPMISSLSGWMPRDQSLPVSLDLLGPLANIVECIQ